MHTDIPRELQRAVAKSTRLFAVNKASSEITNINQEALRISRIIGSRHLLNVGLSFTPKRVLEGIGCWRVYDERVPDADTPLLQIESILDSDTCERALFALHWNGNLLQNGEPASEEVARELGCRFLAVVTRFEDQFIVERTPAAQPYC